MPPKETTTTDSPTRRAVSLPWVAAASAWAMLIFAGSAMPGSKVPGHFGSAGHFGEYLVLGFLLTLARDRSDDRFGSALMALALASAFGITDELHQAFVPLRTPDPADWLVDTGGAALGAVLAVTVMALRARNARRRGATQ